MHSFAWVWGFQSVPVPLSTNSRSVNRHLDFVEESIEPIRRVVRNSDFVDKPVLRSYFEEIGSLKGELYEGSRRTYRFCMIWEIIFERPPISHVKIV